MARDKAALHTLLDARYRAFREHKPTVTIAIDLYFILAKLAEDGFRARYGEVERDGEREA